MYWMNENWPFAPRTPIFFLSFFPSFIQKKIESLRGFNFDDFSFPLLFFSNAHLFFYSTTIFEFLDSSFFSFHWLFPRLQTHLLKNWSEECQLEYLFFVNEKTQQQNPMFFSSVSFQICFKKTIFKTAQSVFSISVFQNGIKKCY